MDPKENYEFFNPYTTVTKKVELHDEAHLKKYIMWENKSNICWLDASMALVAHNKVMKKYSSVHPTCKISRIISTYDDAIRILNSPDKNMTKKINIARGMLNYVQESTLQYLQPILKYKTGDPESAFCSLYNLLIQDSVVKQIFDVTWISVKECTDCGHHSESKKSKPIVTLSNIDSFDPENLSIIYRCTCNKSQQKIKLVYVSLPPCLIFHFENGAGNEKPTLNFTTRGREYHLTGIMTLEKSLDSGVNHFITWVRNIAVNQWLDCNDLNSDIISFSPNFPEIAFKDVYMYVYESFDELGTITDVKIVKSLKSEEHIPCFDLSEESDSENCNLLSNATESNKDIVKIKAPGSDLKSSSDSITFPELNSNAPLKRSVSTDSKSTIDKKIQHANFTQYVKDSSNSTVHINNNENQMEANENKVYDNNVLKTSTNINSTSSDGNSTKEISENNCKSDLGESNDKTNTKINVIPEALKECRVSSISTDSHGNVDASCKNSAETEQTQSLSLNTAENNRNKNLTSKKVCSSTSGRKPENLKSFRSIKLKDLIKIKQEHDKTTAQKEAVKNSEQISTSSDVGQCNVGRLAFNSASEREMCCEQFLSDAANSSGTSYVKLSFLRKKFPSPVTRKISGNDTNHSDSGETFHDVANDIPSSSKSLKRCRVDEDSNSIPGEVSEKKRRLSNAREDTVSTTKRKGRYSKSREKSIRNTSTRKSLVKSELFSEQNVDAGAIEDAKASNKKSGNDVKVLKDFEDVWSSHESHCNCDSADLEETIDIVVDYTFAYICKLSKEFKKSKIQ